MQFLFYCLKKFVQITYFLCACRNPWAAKPISYKSIASANTIIIQKGLEPLLRDFSRPSFYSVRTNISSKSFGVKLLISGFSFKRVYTKETAAPTPVTRPSSAISNFAV